MIPVLTSRIVRDVESLRCLSPEWSELWHRCGNLTSFQRPEWLVPWVEVFQPQELRVVEVRRAHELVGLAPLFCYQREGERVLAPLGAGITDYLDWLVKSELAVEVVAQIFACLHESNEMWDCLELPDMCADSCLLKHLDLFGFQPTAHEVCPTLQLSSNASPPVTVFSERQRKNLRTAHNRTRKAGTAQVELADKKRLPEFLDALLRLHTSRWQQFGRPGVLCDEAVQKFHERATPGLFEAGILRLYGLRFEGDLVAVLYVLWDKKAAYFYLQGFDTAYAFLSPGAQVIAAAIEDAAKHGRRVIDFLRGREAYKYAWGASDVFTHRLQITRGELSQYLSNLEQEAA
jgi:CelD/BcsL family acetyltransferase involved in cellulose biosynthesis